MFPTPASASNASTSRPRSHAIPITSTSSSASSSYTLTNSVSLPDREVREGFALGRISSEPMLALSTTTSTFFVPHPLLRRGDRRKISPTKVAETPAVEQWDAALSITPEKSSSLYGFSLAMLHSFKSHQMLERQALKTESSITQTIKVLSRVIKLAAFLNSRASDSSEVTSVRLQVSTATPIDITESSLIKFMRDVSWYQARYISGKHDDSPLHKLFWIKELDRLHDLLAYIDALHMTLNQVELYLNLAEPIRYREKQDARASRELCSYKLLLKLPIAAALLLLCINMAKNYLRESLKQSQTNYEALDVSVYYYKSLDKQRLIENITRMIDSQYLFFAINNEIKFMDEYWRGQMNKIINIRGVNYLDVVKNIINLSISMTAGVSAVISKKNEMLEINFIKKRDFDRMQDESNRGKHWTWFAINSLMSFHHIEKTKPENHQMNEWMINLMENLSLLVKTRTSKSIESFICPIAKTFLDIKLSHQKIGKYSLKSYALILLIFSRSLTSVDGSRISIAYFSSLSDVLMSTMNKAVENLDNKSDSNNSFIVMSLINIFCIIFSSENTRSIGQLREASNRGMLFIKPLDALMNTFIDRRLNKSISIKESALREMVSYLIEKALPKFLEYSVVETLSLKNDFDSYLIRLLIKIMLEEESNQVNYYNAIFRGFEPYAATIINPLGLVIKDRKLKKFVTAMVAPTKHVPDYILGQIECLRTPDLAQMVTYIQHVDLTGKSLLERLLMIKNEDLVCALIPGLNLSLEYGRGQTLLHFAAQYGCQKVLEKAVSHDLFINSLNEDYENAFQVAVKHNNMNIAKYLAECGVNINNKNKQGYTAYQMLYQAEAWADTEQLSLLLGIDLEPPQIDVQLESEELSIPQSSSNSFHVR